MRKKISVSIGIPAYNSEQNIMRLLNSVVNQTENNFIVREIVLISDNSSDRTVELAHGINDRRIRILNGKNRLGQSKRLNQLIGMLKGDILVFLDDDVSLNDNQVLSNLLKPFFNEQKTALVCGNPQPLPAKTFFGKAVNNLYLAYNYVRENWRGGNNIYGVWGCCIAIRRDFAKSLILPSDVIADSFMYFSCKKQGLNFRYQQKALVWMGFPQIVEDQIKQGSRFLANGIRLGKYFNEEIIKNEYTIPLSFHIKVFLSQVLKNPLGYLFLKVVNAICLFKSQRKLINPRWERINS